MKKFVFILILIITCAGRMPAQVIIYTIDPSFNSELTLTRGGVSDIIHTSTNKYLVMGNYFQASPQAGVFFTESGQYIYNFLEISGYYVQEYRGRYLKFGNHLGITGEAMTPYSDFKFEFQKQLYSGPLANIALDVLILENDNILVAGRFFTDSTLMNTNIESQGLRQLCLIDSLGIPVPGFPMVHCTQPIDAAIHRIDSLSDGSYIISGQFTEVNGYMYNNIAKLNPDFSLDTTFYNILTPSSAVGIRLVDSQDRIWVGGGPNVALQSNPDEPIRYARLLSNGELDSSFSRPILQTLVGSNDDILAIRSPYVVVEDTDGTFIFGGNFVYVNGNYHKCLVKVQDDGTVVENAFSNLGADGASWPGYEPVSGAVAGTDIKKILKLPDGNLLIGGEFSSFGGEPYSCLVRLQPSGFVGVDEKEGRGKLKVYPNPAREFITIQLPDKNQRLTQVQLYDLNGRLVQEVNIVDASGKIDLINLPQGMYVVKAISEKQVFTGKVLVE
ncbi:T9SS type A sorting domain-containing protein [Cryomorpha ignava]|uniref:T9SS type A sorting domain-containing protein n=1 Tax=Cryomorpha ignava TaxID=101383 RepID=A0A7K3WW41_9FLAO|nr:T9SS type A sorting domain-containing protein [Cryomorpha ignava]NEN25853.1 T9SS type A sorting domain-containing protein [Cryomorpha ignava]